MALGEGLHKPYCVFTMLAMFSAKGAKPLSKCLKKVFWDYLNLHTLRLITSTITATIIADNPETSGFISYINIHTHSNSLGSNCVCRSLGKRRFAFFSCVSKCLRYTLSKHMKHSQDLKQGGLSPGSQEHLAEGMPPHTNKLIFYPWN